MTHPLESLYRAVFDAAPGPILIHETESGVVQAASDTVCDLLGVARRELVGTGVGAFSPPEYTTDDAEAVIHRAVTEGTATVEWVAERDSGDERLVEVTLRRVAAGEDVYVAADELLEDIFGNILLNAVEHGGDEAAIGVDATADDEQVTVRIADNGPGIPPGRRRRVFERGEKGTGSSGTGFGLYSSTR